MSVFNKRNIEMNKLIIAGVSMLLAFASLADDMQCKIADMTKHMQEINASSAKLNCETQGFKALNNFAHGDDATTTAWEAELKTAWNTAQNTGDTNFDEYTYCANLENQFYQDVSPLESQTQIDATYCDSVALSNDCSAGAEYCAAR